MCEDTKTPMLIYRHIQICGDKLFAASFYAIWVFRLSLCPPFYSPPLSIIDADPCVMYTYSACRENLLWTPLSLSHFLFYFLPQEQCECVGWIWLILVLWRGPVSVPGRISCGCDGGGGGGYACGVGMSDMIPELWRLGWTLCILKCAGLSTTLL